MKRIQMKKNVLLALLLAAVILSWLTSPPRLQALMALPDIGINYRTMTVDNADRITAAGMKDARNGDRIAMSVSREQKLIFKNLRTGEELSYPPERPLKKSR
jgi:hypothetical protein